MISGMKEQTQGLNIATAHSEDKLEEDKPETVSTVDTDERKEKLMYCMGILNINNLIAQIQA